MMDLLEVTTGIEFEKYIEDRLEHTGIPVSTTKTSNDYGADLIFEYKDYRFAVQCKYYSKTVGIKAVQEIIGALQFYSAHYGIVITNSTFTQQASNLASSNNILLIDGTVLENFFGSDGNMPILDLLLLDCNTSEKITNAQTSKNKEWTINDLVMRYGVSSSTIYKNFLGQSLPYYKVGKEYRFDPNEVTKWEISKQRVPYRRNGSIELPAFVSYRKNLIQALKEAKKEKNKEKIKAIKQEMKEHQIHYRSFLRIILDIVMVSSGIAILVSLIVGLCFGW